MSTGAGAAGVEGCLRKSSQQAKAWCRASRVAAGPDPPSGRKGWVGQCAHCPTEPLSRLPGAHPSPAQLLPHLVPQGRGLLVHNL